jgi:hypothetical protein
MGERNKESEARKAPEADKKRRGGANTEPRKGGRRISLT